jgi:AraC-like DNA-binding protein
LNPYFFHFSTEAYPEHQLFDVWRDEVNAIFDIGIEKPASPRFNYQLSTGYVGSILMGCGAWAGEEEPVAYSVKRPSRMIRRDGLDHYYLCLGITHSISGLAGRASINAEASKIYILDLARELDSEIIAGDTIILTIARDLLDARVRAANLHGTVLHGALATLLGDHMHALRRQLPNLTPEEIPHVEQATLAMVSAALAPSVATLADAESEINQTVLNRVRRFIDSQLKSPELTPSLICREVGISRAQLYRLFARESGVVFYIQQRRLGRIRQILEGRKGNEHRISTLAFEYGFKSESHFSRAFRQAFGYSPREARDKGSSFATSGKKAVEVSERPASLREVLGRLD